MSYPFAKAAFSNLDGVIARVTRPDPLPAITLRIQDASIQAAFILSPDDAKALAGALLEACAAGDAG